MRLSIVAISMPLVLGASPVAARGVAISGRPAGATLWISRYRGPEDGPASAASIAVSGDGARIFLTGASSPSHLEEQIFTTAALDEATGHVEWIHGTQDPGLSNDRGFFVTTSPDGTRAFATGTVGSDAYSPATIAYDAATGRKVWLRRQHQCSCNSVAFAAAVEPNGGTVFVAGAFRDRFTAVAYDAASGHALWAERYRDGSAMAIATSPDGSMVFVSGMTLGSTDNDDATTIAYDAATGQPVWLQRYNGPAHGYDAATKLVVSPDGSRVFVTGTSTGGGGSLDYLTVAYDALTGQPLWVRRYHGPGRGDDVTADLGLTGDGATLFVTGQSLGPHSSYDYATLAYDAATGQPRWLERYNGNGHGFDQATGLAVAPDGTTVYVTGSSEGKDSFDDFATIAYDASTGEPTWLQRYNGPTKGYDFAYDIAVSPDGAAVFVTGASAQGATTIAYATS